ncbi:MAG: ribosome maturation factor RimP [Fidelibacterota bacterium]
MDMKEDPHKGLIRCIIDSENPISLVDTTRISKTIQNSGILDNYYPDGASLEVTSFGITESFTQPFQFRKNVGRRLNIIYDKDGYKKNVKAELSGFDGETLFLRNKNRGQFQLSLTKILDTKVVIQFK